MVFSLTTYVQGCHQRPRPLPHGAPSPSTCLDALHTRGKALARPPALARPVCCSAARRPSVLVTQKSCIPSSPSALRRLRWCLEADQRLGRCALSPSAASSFLARHFLINCDQPQVPGRRRASSPCHHRPRPLPHDARSPSTCLVAPQTRGKQ